VTGTFIIETNNLVGDTFFLTKNSLETFWEWCREDAKEKNNVVLEFILCAKPVLIIVDNPNEEQKNLPLECLEAEAELWEKIKLLDSVFENVVKIYSKSALCGVVPLWFDQKIKLFKKIDRFCSRKVKYANEIKTCDVSHLAEYNRIMKYKELAKRTWSTTAGTPPHSVNATLQKNTGKEDGVNSDKQQRDRAERIIKIKKALKIYYTKLVNGEKAILTKIALDYGLEKTALSKDRDDVMQFREHLDRMIDALKKKHKGLKNLDTNTKGKLLRYIDRFLKSGYKKTGEEDFDFD